MASLTTIFNTSAGEGTDAPNSAPMSTAYNQRETETSFIAQTSGFYCLSNRQAGKPAAAIVTGPRRGARPQPPGRAQLGERGKRRAIQDDSRLGELRFAHPEECVTGLRGS